VSAACAARAPTWGRGPDDDEIPIGEPDDGDWEDADDDEEDDDEEPLQVRPRADDHVRA